MLIDHGHRHGLDVFLSMRVNDIHDGRLPEGDPLISPMKLSHPDWLLGLTDNPYAGERFSGLSRFGYDSASTRLGNTAGYSRGGDQ